MLLLLSISLESLVGPVHCTTLGFLEFVHDGTVAGAHHGPFLVLTAVQDERCTSLYGVPTMFIAELDHPEFARFDLGSLRTGIMAGSPCPIETMKRVIAEMHARRA